MKKIIFFLFLPLPCLLSSQDRGKYIDQFSPIAISEMQRTGIPASIKLAQGILESNAGASTLATSANNHFGIKCGNEWHGKKMYRKDDDRDKRGRLVKSCFRAFKSAEASYIAHSDFLMDPNKAYRYGRLFTLASDDYRGWARGLKKAGYATNPKYPQLLIKIIEDYELFKFDEGANLFVDREKEEVNKPTIKPNTAPAIRVNRRVYTVKFANGVKYVSAWEGDTPRKIADEMRLPSNRIIQSNEALKRKHQQLEQGQRIYLQPKKSSFKGTQKYHIVKPGETMMSISDRYAVKLKKLLSRNQMEAGTQPKSGQKIYLKGKNPGSVKTENRSSNNKNQQANFLWDDHTQTVQVDESIPTTTEVISNQITMTEPTSPVFVQYTVQPKDTLYGIARLHGTSVDILKNLNNLGDTTIHPGQVLKVQ